MVANIVATLRSKFTDKRWKTVSGNEHAQDKQIADNWKIIRFHKVWHIIMFLTQQQVVSVNIEKTFNKIISIETLDQKQ
jgi:hypothetical protein